MEDTKIYDFMLKLNTFLNRQNILARKLIIQEQEIGRLLIAAKTLLPAEIFDAIFVPMNNALDERIKILQDMEESGSELNKSLIEFYDQFKGIVQ